MAYLQNKFELNAFTFLFKINFMISGKFYNTDLETFALSEKTGKFAKVSFEK